MIGKTLGHYRVGEQLGRGGMGEVYVADDLNLNRKVALKFLPDAFAGDPERMARFEREAKLVASLNHPNIAAIYGLEQAEGKRFLVLELVEGETLQQRLSKGPLQIEEALGVCRQIAEALEDAHEKGVIHRDLKPANVMITAGDKVKILDFGLAKALSDETQSVDSSQSPTLTEAMTRPGVILGTAAYMSPEQAKGKAVDKRADIWAFGCILYECLTGKRAFEGETVTETLAAILKGEPDWNALPATTPPNIRFVQRRCLEKAISRRFRDPSDLLIVIDEAHDIGEATAPSRHKTRERLGWIVAALLFVIAGASLTRSYFHQTATEERSVRFSIAPPEQGTFSWYASLEISPDGRQIVFVATVNGKQMLWVRSLDSLESRFLPGTEGARSPFWSPDSQSIGFFSNGKLNTLGLSGGVPHPVCDALPYYEGGTWNRDGTIVFTKHGGEGPIYGVSASGGTTIAVTVLDASKQEIRHSRPHFLPDGRHFLYFARSRVPANNAIYVGSLDSGESKRLFASDSEARYAPPGYLLFVNQSVLMAQRFNADSMELSGDPARLVDSVHFDPEPGTADLSISADGTLAYRSGRLSTRLVWVDRAGKEISAIGPPGEYRNATLSPDEKRVIVDRFNPQALSRDLWLYDIARQTASRFTYDPADDSDAVWSPVGLRVVFASDRNGTRGLYQKIVDGNGQEENVMKSDLGRLVPRDWSSDGRFIFYFAVGEQTGTHVWYLSLSGERKPTRFLQTAFDELEPHISPDGHWIAYDSNESGKRQVYVCSFPGADKKIQISTTGGNSPMWRHDGQELYFLSEDGQMMAAPVSIGPKFEPGLPKALFPAIFPDWDIGGWPRYSVSADGQRFLINRASEEVFSPITVVLNWAAGLKK
jgi:serine/threonine protein kinase